MAEEELKPVYAIHGEDRARVERVLEALVARVLSEGGLPPERMPAGETPGAEVVAACEALSLAGRRLVIVEGVEEWRAADVAPVAEYLSAPNPATCLALVGGAAPPGKLAEAVRSIGKEFVYGPSGKVSRKDRARWMSEHAEREVARFGGRIAPAATRRLVERATIDRPEAHRSGVNAMQLTQEARKLASAAGGQSIDPALVDALVPAHPDARVYELTDAIVARDGRRVFGLLADLAGGDQPADPERIRFSLGQHVRNLAAVVALGPGASADAVTEATGVAGFPARKLQEQAAALPPRAAERAVARVAALEIELRISAVRDLGEARGDGPRLLLERAARDLLAIVGGEQAA
jgi:DNA polymerase III delta subunit